MDEFRNKFDEIFDESFYRKPAATSITYNALSHEQKHTITADCMLLLMKAFAMASYYSGQSVFEILQFFENNKEWLEHEIEKLIEFYKNTQQVLGILSALQPGETEASEGPLQAQEGPSGASKGEGGPLGNPLPDRPENEK